jgi:TatA/E family protein of Tat protein translocase
VFSLGGTEILLIAGIALLLFGPDKIPQMARTVGRFMREFNKYKDIMESTVRAEIYKEDWTKDAEPDTKTASERISQAAGAVQGLVAEQKAKDAATEGGSPSEPPAGHIPSIATDEDEEDEV